MVVMRLVLGLLLLAGLVCLGLAVTTRQPKYRQAGIVIIRWTVVAGLAAFGVLLIERLFVML